MAAVFRAIDVNLGRPVALKILPPELARDSQHVQRFAQEAKAAALLDHPGVARVYHCDTDQGLHFIAFEYVEGKTLRSLIDQAGRLPSDVVLPIIAQVARGLAHAADRGVTHRDVKPSNIIVNEAGEAKLVDMGLARYSALDADALTRSGTTLGTFDYMSPEQALDPRGVDARSDVYSLGCTLYHALTGVPPVPQGTAAKKLHHHQQVAPADPRDFVPDLSPELIAVLARAMVKRPGDRYQHPRELAEDLEALQRPFGHATAEKPRISATTAESPGYGWIAAASALAVVTLVALSEWWQAPRPNASALLWAYSNASPANAERGAAAALPQRDAANVDELRHHLALDEVAVRLTGEDYRIPASDRNVLVFSGRRLILTSADPDRPARIVIGGNNGETSALTFQCAAGSSVMLNGLHFDCAAGPNHAAIASLGAEQVHIDRCVFRGFKATAFLAAPVAGTAPDRGTLVVSETAFVRCREAIRVAGGGRVEMKNVAALDCGDFLILGRPGDRKPLTARLEGCTIRQPAGNVFKTVGDVGGIIEVGASLFASLGDSGPTLIDQVGGGEFEFRTLYLEEGSRLRNAYHAIPIFWRTESRGATVIAASPEECLRHDLPFFDDDPLLVTALEFAARDLPAQLPSDARPWLTPRARLAGSDRIGIWLSPWGPVEPMDAESRSGASEK